jgi:hypothetical protein
MADSSGEIISKNQKTVNIKGYLRWAALFLGELRDGLTMVRETSQQQQEEEDFYARHACRR